MSIDSCPHGVSYATSEDCPGCERAEAKVLEDLAAIEHDQWATYARHTLNSERLSKFRRAKWEALLVPYLELSEVDKEKDRVFARKVLDYLRQNGHLDLTQVVVPPEA